MPTAWLQRDFRRSPARGASFSIILVVRYLVETGSHVAEAVAALCRIPVALSQTSPSWTKRGSATVFLSPERAPAVTRALVRANHQDAGAPIGSSKYVTSSIARQQSAGSCDREPRRHAFEADWGTGTEKRLGQFRLEQPATDAGRASHLWQHSEGPGLNWATRALQSRRRRRGRFLENTVSTRDSSSASTCLSRAIRGD